MRMLSRQPFLLPSWILSAVLAVSWVSCEKKTAVNGFFVVETKVQKQHPSSTTTACQQSIVYCQRTHVHTSINANVRHHPGCCQRCFVRPSRLGCSSSGSRHPDENHGDDGNDSLETLSELLSRLLRVGSSNVDPNSSQEQRQRQLLTTRLSNAAGASAETDIRINRTYVETSTVFNAGKGLFARGDYPKGTLLTCYPGDALIEFANAMDDNNADVVNNDEQGREVIWGSHTKKYIWNQTTTPSTLDDDDDGDDTTKIVLRQEYMLRAIRDDWGIVAVPELFADGENGNDFFDADIDKTETGSIICAYKDPSYLGHFANDGAANPPRRESELAAYTIESANKANAMHKSCEGCHMVTVATRDIKAGEEIFVTYGPEYWSEQSTFAGPRMLSNGGENYGVDENDDDDENDGEEEDYYYCENDYDGEEEQEEEFVEDDDYGYYDEEAGIIVNEIILLSEEKKESPSRGMGFG